MEEIQTNSEIGFPPPEAKDFNFELKVADAVWIATALLHFEQPDCDETGFSIEQIVRRVLDERLTRRQQQTIYQHVNQHCVANRKAEPNRNRALYSVGGRNRRLWRTSDPYDPAREGAPSKPMHLPSKYAYLLDWYEHWNGKYAGLAKDPLLALVGSGAHIWASEHADGYVNRLREGWK
jgi:hypothetical protein